MLLECKSVRDAIVDLLAAYSTFDIAYPKAIGAIHILCEIKDKQVRNLNRLM